MVDQTDRGGAGLKAARSAHLTRLLMAASIGAIAVAAPTLASAQVLPTGCTDAVTSGTPNNNDSNFDAGETITCLAPPTPIAPIDTSVNDLTIIVGDENTPTEFSGGSNAIDLRLSDGDISIIVNNDSSAVSGTGSGILASTGFSAVSDLTIQTAGAVTGGVTGIFAEANAAGRNVSVTATGQVSSGVYGVIARNTGTGSTEVSATSVTGTNEVGIGGYGSSTTTDLTISATGDVIGGLDGVEGTLYGTGDLTINANNVTATNTNNTFSIPVPAINAVVDGNGQNLSVSATGVVSGIDFGVRAFNNGTGTVVVDVVDVSATADNGDGIYAFGGANTTGMSITSTGTVSSTGAIGGGGGLPYGVYANHNGSGSLVINANQVTSTNGTGVQATVSAGENIDITATGTVTGGFRGIYAFNGGTGTTTINVVDALATTAYGIDITNATASQAMSITASGTVSGFTGIDADHRGTGILTINVNDVTGTDEWGIRANVRSVGQDLNLTSTGTVSGNLFEGIYTLHDGSGSTTINVNNVSSTSSDGVRARNVSAGQNLSVTGTGLISGTSGIDADHDGTGNLTINVNNVTGTGVQGINADVSAAGRDLSVTATGTVSGVSTGVQAINNGAGTVVVDVVDVSATADDGDAIYAFGGANTTGMSITSTGTVSSTGANGVASGEPNGIYADHNGSGALVINANQVTSTNGTGINADLSAGTNIEITATGTVTGGYRGVYVYNGGTGTTTLNVVDSYATTNYGIDVFTGTTAQGVGITATGTVSGFTGVEANHFGSDSLTINVNDVTGTGEWGIRASVQSAGQDLNITSTGSVSGNAFEGIYALHDGSGSTTINVNNVSSTSYDGVRARNRSAGQDLSVTATGLVSGATNGIYADNQGTGATMLDVVDVTSTGTSSSAVRLNSATTTTSTSLTSTGTLSGDQDGVFATHFGSGLLSIDVNNAEATGAVGTAINVVTTSTLQDAEGVSIRSSGLLSGPAGLILVSTRNADSIIAVNDVNTSFGAGIEVTQASNTGALSITSTGTITAEQRGVYTAHTSAGLHSINVNNVTSNTAEAIRATATTLATDLAVTATGTINGATAALYTSNQGSGTTTVDVVDVTSSGLIGVDLRGGIGSSGITLTSTGTITADTAALSVIDSGIGPLTVSVHNVYNTSLSSGAPLSVFGSTNTAEDVSVTSTGTLRGAASPGIFNSGEGNLFVDINNSTSTSYTGLAIFTSQGSNAADVITRGNIVGNRDGIQIYHDGRGALNITTAGAAGGEDGIFIDTETAASVTISGAVGGATGYGVNFQASPETLTTLNSGAEVSGGTSAFAFAAGSNDTVILNEGASIIGPVALLDGNDRFNDAGGTVASVDGGAGTDTFEISGGVRNVAGGLGSNFEILEVTANGARLTGNFAGFTSAAFVSGANTLAGSIDAGTTTINSGATLTTEDTAAFTGGLINSGTLNLVGGVSAASFTQTANGVLNTVVTDTVNDVLTVSGPVSLSGILNASVPLQPGTGVGESQSVTIIDGSGGVSGNFTTANVGTDGLLIQRTVEIDTANSDVNVVARVNPITTLTTLTKDQESAGGALLSLLGSDTLDPALLQFIDALGSQSTEAAIASTLNELNPEGFDAGLRLTSNAQYSLFANMMRVANAAGSPDKIQVASLTAVPLTEQGRRGFVTWGEVRAAGLEQDADGNDFGFDGDALDVVAGLTVSGLGPVSLGLAAGYSTFDGDTQEPFSDAIETDLYQVALSAHYLLDSRFLNGELEGVMGFANGESTLSMQLSDPSTNGTIRQSGDADISSLSLLTRFTVSGRGDTVWPIHPHLEFGVTDLSQDATTIGAGMTTGLAVEEVETTFMQFGVGASFSWPVSQKIAWESEAGYTQFFGDTENLYRSRFTAAAPSTFSTEGASLESQFTLETGVLVDLTERVELSVNGFGQFGDLETFGARVALSRQF